jgi:hypothetical protein
MWFLKTRMNIFKASNYKIFKKDQFDLKGNYF